MCVNSSWEASNEVLEQIYEISARWISTLAILCLKIPNFKLKMKIEENYR